MQYSKIIFIHDFYDIRCHKQILPDTWKSHVRNEQWKYGLNNLQTFARFCVIFCIVYFADSEKFMTFDVIVSYL